MIPYFNLDVPLIRTNFGEEFLDMVQDEEEENEHLIIEKKIININEDKEPNNK